MWPWLGPPLTSLQNVKCFRFCDAMVTYHWANRPESSTALYFEEVRQVAVPVGRQTTSVWKGSLECGTGGKSAIYHCLVTQRLFSAYATVCFKEIKASQKLGTCLWDFPRSLDLEKKSQLCSSAINKLPSSTLSDGGGRGQCCQHRPTTVACR